MRLLAELDRCDRELREIKACTGCPAWLIALADARLETGEGAYQAGIARIAAQDLINSSA